MGYALLYCTCINCHTPMACNPVYVPSLVVNGVKEPLCEACFHEWNRLRHRDKGLPAIPLHPDAYKACHESELPSE